MELILTSIVAFVSTNIDDIFILMLFFANKKYKTNQIVLGQYIGIIAIISISFVGSLIGLFIDQRYIGLLGLLPVCFGIRSLIQLILHHDESQQKETRSRPSPTNKTAAVAAVTIANGGDNIGIYIPLFATLLTSQKAIMIFIFLVMTSVWCFFANYLSKHPSIAGIVDRYGHTITPIALIALGFYILYESETFQLLQMI